MLMRSYAARILGLSNPKAEHAVGRDLVEFDLPRIFIGGVSGQTGWICYPGRSLEYFHSMEGAVWTLLLRLVFPKHYEAASHV